MSGSSILHHSLGSLWWVSVGTFSSSLVLHEFSPAYYSTASPTSRPSVLCCTAMTLLHCHHNVLNQPLKMDSALVNFLNNPCLLHLRDTTTYYKTLGLNISYRGESWGCGHRMGQNSNLHVRKSTPLCCLTVKHSIFWKKRRVSCKHSSRQQMPHRP